MADRLVLAGGLVFDGSGTDPYRADVGIENGRIVEIGSGLEGAVVVDVAGRTVLPGFIDCHTHVAFSTLRGLEENAALSPSYLAFEAIASLRATLDAGITTVRDGAGADAGYRSAIEDGLVPGPRLLVSLSQLSPGAGPYDPRTPSGFRAWVDRPGIPSPMADGADALRAKVREYVQAGADVIKIFATGHFAMAREGAMRSLFTDAELGAIVDEASRHGIRVMAHAHGAAGAAAAARAGAASIDHGIYLDDDALDAMAAAGTVLVPTLLASNAMLAGATDDRDRDRTGSIVEGHRAVVRSAHLRGIPIAMGTDCPMTPHGRNLEELQLLVECGLTPAEALVAATSTAARLLGLEAAIGRIDLGLRADVVVVEGDPLDVTGLVARIADVYQAGRRVGPSTRG